MRGVYNFASTAALPHSLNEGPRLKNPQIVRNVFARNTQPMTG